jgi:hypothetical protein
MPQGRGPEQPGLSAPGATARMFSAQSPGLFTERSVGRTLQEVTGEAVVLLVRRGDGELTANP